MRGNVLLNKVYSKFHNALFSLKSTDIGVSFPKYQIMLGDVMRIHASQSKLIELQSNDWLGELIGYCDLTNILRGKLLTKTEAVILNLILQGRSNKGIAHILHRSVRTIEDHRNHIMRKLDVDNVVDLVKRATAMGMMDLSGSDDNKE